MAPSWGKFQILGSNHKACGHATVQSFVKAMTTSEREHLRAFATFVAANPAMLTALRQKDWAGFAKRYNGPDYAKFNYDQKMRDAYRKFAG
jgi:N-acetylmuramidase